MKPEGSFPFSQELEFCSSRESVQSNLYYQTLFFQELFQLHYVFQEAFSLQIFRLLFLRISHLFIHHEKSIL
jgi:hypothetical protein